MGYDSKYGTVTTEHGDIPADEPVIVFRARDRLAPAALRHYAGLCRDAGSPDFHVDLCTATAREFEDWQQDHPDRVRTPDSAAHKARMVAGIQ